MMRGIKMGAPMIVGAYVVTSICADTYHDRRRWTDWLAQHVNGPCLILEHEGTSVRQDHHFADFAAALAFFLRWGGDTIDLMTGAVNWTDIETGGRRYSPCVFARDWPLGITDVREPRENREGGRYIPSPHDS